MANFTALKTAINNAIKTNGNEEITGAILQAILDAMVETLGDSAITDLENAITTEVTNRENAVGDMAADLAAEVQARQALDYNVNNRINAEEYNRQNADAALSQTMSQGFQTLGSQMTALNAAISALNAAYQNGYLYGGIATPSSSPSNNKCFYIALQGGTYTNFGGVGVIEGINIIKNDSGWKVEHIYDQTTLLNEFYLLRQQVIRAISSIDPIVIQGDVTNAPDEEDLTSDAQHLLKFKDRAYSPLNFSGLGMKILRKNIAPLSDSAPFNGFVEGVTAEETLSGTPTQIFWERMNTRFVGIKDGVYYLDWTDSDNYVPVSTSLVYMYNGTPYQWTGSDFIVDETEVPNLVNCLTQDMINEANTVYIIRYDYTLKEDITIPANCVLEFDGGSLNNGTIISTNTYISSKRNIGNINIVNAIKNSYIIPEFFGAVGDGITDDTAAIQKAVNYCEEYGKTLYLENSYFVTNTILITGSSLELVGKNVDHREMTKVGAFDIIIDGRVESLFNIGNDINMPIASFKFSRIAACTQLYRDNNINYGTQNFIKYTTTYMGPQWPIIIDYCFFDGFGYYKDYTSGNDAYGAILYIKSSNRYCAAWLHLLYNAGKNCGYLVYTYTSNYVLGCIIEHNFWHQNRYGINIIAQFMLRVCYNNFEYCLNVPCVIKGLAGAYLTTVFNYNYFEGVSQPVDIKYVNLMQHYGNTNFNNLVANGLIIDSISTKWTLTGAIHVLNGPIEVHKLTKSAVLCDYNKLDNSYINTLLQPSTYIVDSPTTTYIERGIYKIDGYVFVARRFVAKNNWFSIGKTSNPVSTGFKGRAVLFQTTTTAATSVTVVRDNSIPYNPLSFYAAGKDSIKTILIPCESASVNEFVCRFDQDVYIYSIVDITEEASGINKWIAPIVSSKYYKESGNTNDRPTFLTSDDKGCAFYDETEGKPIWWNGTAWVDATGATV